MSRARGSSVAVTIVTTTETVVATLPGISPPLSGTVDLVGCVDITTGTGTTAVAVNIRRGTGITGTLVQTVAAQNIAAGSRGVIPFTTSDSQNVDVGNQQYVVTVAQTAASANGTVNLGTIRADF